MPNKRAGGYWRTFERLLAVLRRRRFRTAFVGALSLGAHGVHRATEDIDLLVHPEDKDRLLAALAEVFTLSEDLDTLVVWTHPKTGVDVVVLVPFDAVSLQAREGSVPATVRGHRVRVVDREDLAAMKSIAAVDSPGNERRHGADIEALVRQGQLDVNAVSRLLQDEAGVEYARYFMDCVRRARAFPERTAPKRRS